MCLSQIIPQLLANAAPVAQIGVATPPAPSSRAVPRPRGHDPDVAPPVVGVALLNGCGGALGASLAEALAERGVAVGLLVGSREEAATGMARLRAAGGATSWAIADVTDPAAVACAVVALRSRLGPIDLLVNDARGLGPRGPLWEVDLAAWWGTVEASLKGVLLCTRLVLPGMVGRRRGRIINLVGPDMGPAHCMPRASGRSVAAAAVRALTEDLARDARRHGVAAFSVDPRRQPIGLRAEAPTSAVRLLLRLAAGDGDALSGRHLSVHDDLDGLVARHQEAARTAAGPAPERRAPIAPLGRATASPADSRRRPNRAPAYYLGRPAALWQQVMRRGSTRRLPASSLFDRAA